METISVLLTLTPSQGLRNFLFTMKFLSQNYFYVNNMCDKFESQKNLIKKDIQNLSACLDMRNHFTTTNFDTLPKGWILFIYHEILFTRSSLC